LITIALVADYRLSTYCVIERIKLLLIALHVELVQTQ
jgi:hypothetical protein